MELFNFRIDNVEKGTPEGSFHSEGHEEAKKLKAPLIHWVPKGATVKCHVILPDNSIASGEAEESCKELKVDMIVQFERFGFVRVDAKTEKRLVSYYCHR